MMWTQSKCTQMNPQGYLVTHQEWEQEIWGGGDLSSPPLFKGNCAEMHEMQVSNYIGSVKSCQKYLNKGSINPTPTYILKIQYCNFRNYFDLFHVLCVCCYSISTFRNLRMMDRNTFVNDVSREIIENAINVSYVRTQNFSSIDLREVCQ